MFKLKAILTTFSELKIGLLKINLKHRVIYLLTNNNNNNEKTNTVGKESIPKGYIYLQYQVNKQTLMKSSFNHWSIL